MSDLRKALLATITFLTFIPNAAWALPRNCDEVCNETIKCSALCWEGQVITCGDWGVCNELPPDAGVMASVDQGEVWQSDASLLVCIER